jgi:pSer/pThr/pTyr-binding forkhead associated (FHA) protein
MWRIIALDKDAREVARAELVAGEVTIGRDPDRQIQLNSASVSRRHARIVVNGPQLLVFDDGSANGIMVNGNRVGTPTPVDARSKIEIADFRIVVESSAPAEATPSVAPFGTAAVAESLRLVAQGGPYDARVFPVIGEVMVGRAAENQLVLDDPSLSRKHARLRGSGHRLEVEDQGSSNGTFVNGRKIGHALAGPGDTIRFGELSFRIEDERGMGRPPDSGGSMLALVGVAGVTIIILITAMVVTLRKPPVLRASGKDAIAKIAKQAEQHLKAGKERFAEKKWSEAKSELDATIELDPANVEARRLKAIAAHAPEDDRLLGSALNALGAGDRRGIEIALRLREEISQGSQARQQLEQKATARLLAYGLQCATARDYADTAWALCRAYEIDPAQARSDARVSTELHEAEKRLAHDRGFTPCRAAR